MPQADPLDPRLPEPATPAYPALYTQPSLIARVRSVRSGPSQDWEGDVVGLPQARVPQSDPLDPPVFFLVVKAPNDFIPASSKV